MELGCHANRHVGKFLALKGADSSSVLQVLQNGKVLTARNILNGKLSLSNPILVHDSPESIGMTIPRSGKKGAVQVRDIANVIGHAYPVSVIDVRHQEELQGWTMGDLVEYFEDDDRRNFSTNTKTEQSSSPPRRRRAAATQALQKQQEQLAPKVLNQISLEFSTTPLADMVKSPQFVRDLDWIDIAWPKERRKALDYPMVQYYCLTSTEGCYTDFHVDFGGTAVWYHVLRGEKQFCLIRPTTQNLQVYEDWLCRSNQAELFLPDLIETKEDILTVSLKATQTLVIPTGWIHAVYTPLDSIVIGGNFLHGLDISLQLEIHYLETRTRVPGRFRFPHLVPLMFYAGGMYLRRMQSNDAFVCDLELEGLEDLIGALEGWWKLQADETLVVAAEYAAQTNGCASVEEFLTLLKMERARHLMKKEGAAAQSNATEKPKLRLKLASADTKPRVKFSPPRAKSSTVESPPRARVSLSSSATTQPDVGYDETSSPTFQEPERLELNLSPQNDVAKKPTSSGIRIRLSPEKTASASSDFRIVLPPSSRGAVPKKRKSVQREGLEEYIPAAGDDEWEPEKPKKQRTSSSARPKGKGVGVSKKPSTSRQRLMKRFR